VAALVVVAVIPHKIPLEATVGPAEVHNMEEGVPLDQVVPHKVLMEVLEELVMPVAVAVQERSATLTEPLKEETE
jgi:hypothetical protein